MAEETAAALLEAIEALAWHHGNVQRNDEPELDFNGGTSLDRRLVTAGTRVTRLNREKGDHPRKWPPHEES
jgi:hypothetical protein